MTTSTAVRKTVPKAFRDYAAAQRQATADAITPANYGEFRLVFNTGSCSRCGGCGRYSFNLMDGDKCYGCNGRGVTFTLAARKARKALDELREQVYSVPASEIQVGDFVKFSHSGRRWERVEAVDPTGGGRSKSGSETEWTQCMSISTARTCGSVRPDSTVWRHSDEAAAQVTAAAALMDGVQVIVRKLRPEPTTQ